MNNRKIKKMIRQEFQSVHTPSRKNELLQDIQYISQVRPEDEVHKRKIHIHKSLSLAVVMCMIVIGFLFWPSQEAYSVAFEVNPSIELLTQPIDETGSPRFFSLNAHRPVDDITTEVREIVSTPCHEERAGGGIHQERRIRGPARYVRCNHLFDVRPHVGIMLRHALEGRERIGMADFIEPREADQRIRLLEAFAGGKHGH